MMHETQTVLPGIAAARLPFSGRSNGLVVFVIGLLNGWVVATRPRLQVIEAARDTFFLQPAEPVTWLIGTQVFSFGLVYVLSWLIVSRIVRLVVETPFSDILRRNTVNSLVFLIPPLAGHALVGGRSLYWSSFYLSCVLYGLMTWQVFAGPTSLPGKIGSRSPGIQRLFKPSVLVVFGLAAYYFMIVAGVFHPLEQPTGDEPNYLIVTHSLVADHDLDLANNYRDKDYQVFYSAHLYHRVMVDRQGRWLPSQGIGLPLLLVPGYMIGLKTGQPVFWCRLIVTVLAIICLYQVVRLLMVELGLTHQGLWGVVAVAGSSPFMVYAHQLYPEIPGALFMVLACRYSLRPGRWAPLGAGLCAGLLPWFGIKFIVPLAALMGVWFLMALPLWPCHRELLALYRRPFRLSFSVALIMVLVFFLSFYALYGTFDFVKTHGIKAETTDEPGGSLGWSVLYGFKHLAEAGRIALGNLIDQRVGVLIYSPVYLFFLTGLMLSFTHGHPFGFMALAIVVSHWALFAWTGQWEGFCPPSRYLVPLGPFFAYWLALVFMRMQSHGLRWLVKGLAVASVASGLFIITHLHRFYHFVLWRNPDEKNHELMILSNKIIDWTTVFPSLTQTQPDYTSWIVFSALVLVLTAVTLMMVRRTSAVPEQAGGSRLPIRGLIWSVLIIICFGHLLARFESYPDPKQAFYAVQSSPDGQPVHVMTNDIYAPEETGFWLRGRARTRLLWSCRQAKPIGLTLHSLRNNVVRLVLDHHEAIIPLEAERKITLMFPPLVSGKSSSWFGFERSSDVNIWLYCQHSLRPSDSKETLDRRFLGCFISPE
ncbi:hypothetical protein JXQ70_16310 [bacterium]|nr:hypothetical protein [bacterium]